MCVGAAKAFHVALRTGVKKTNPMTAPLKVAKHERKHSHLSVSRLRKHAETRSVKAAILLRKTLLPYSAVFATIPFTDRCRFDATACRRTTRRTDLVAESRDDERHPVRGALIELWQANAAGAITITSTHAAPPIRISGLRKAVDDAQGVYSFVSIKPARCSLEKSRKCLRPAHISFSLFGAGIFAACDANVFSGRSVCSRATRSSKVFP